MLIRFVVARSTGEFAFWATPGGEVEENETDRAAAERELREELGLALELTDPVHTEFATFEHHRAMVESTDVFFMARCEQQAPQLQAFTAEERAVLREARWWRLSEIENAMEAIFPIALASIVERVSSH